MTAYATVEQLKAELGIKDNRDDSRLTAALEAASRQIDPHCGRPHGFWQDTTVQVRRYRPESPECCFVPHDISTTTGLIVKADTGQDGTYATTLTIGTDFLLRERKTEDWDCLDSGISADEIVLLDAGVAFADTRRPYVQVTARFGWAAIPDPVVNACLIQAKNLYKAASGTFSGFQLSEAAGVAVRMPGLDQVAAALLERYRREL